MMEEDPTIELHRDEQTRDFILSGMGQQHIEIVVEKLKRKYGAEVVLKAPKVPYKETIRATASAQGRLKKQTGGRGQYGDCWIKLEPLPRGEKYEFVNQIVGGVIPRQYIPAVEKGILEALDGGGLAGYPVTDVKVTLYDGSYHSVDSSEMAFKIAGSLALKKAVQQATPILLEPMMVVEVSAPDDAMGDVIGDLNSRRGRVMGVEGRSKSQVIKAIVPLAEMLEYAPQLRSLTADRGDYTMEFSHYEEVPAHLAQKVISEARAEEEIQMARTNTISVLVTNEAGVVTSTNLPPTNPPRAVTGRERVVQQITSFIGNVNSGALGVSSVLALLFVAISLLRTIEATFNDIWGVPRGRPFARRVVYYWAGVTLGPIAPFLSFSTQIPTGIRAAWSIWAGPTREVAVTETLDPITRQHVDAGPRLSSNLEAMVALPVLRDHDPFAIIVEIARHDRILLAGELGSGSHVPIAAPRHGCHEGNGRRQQETAESHTPCHGHKMPPRQTSDQPVTPASILPSPGPGAIARSLPCHLPWYA